ncbi:hypothetical protein INR49_027027 [Caranx melampygus]|nr:hypothetical protein INR49_027027 [Caranx melampygus]
MHFQPERDKKITISILLLCHFVYEHASNTPTLLHKPLCNHITNNYISFHSHMHTDTHTHTHRSMCLVRLSVCHPSEARLPP